MEAKKMRFNQITIAFFLTILFICMPITQALSYDEVNKTYQNINTISSFTVKLTDEQIQELNDFIDNLPSIDDQNTAQDITNQILQDDNEINIHQYGQLFRHYGYENISRCQETTDITDDILNFILQLLIERLGWVYDLLQQTSDILLRAQALWNDKSLPKEIIKELGLLIENLKELQNLSTLLIEGHYLQFLIAWDPGLIIDDITEIIQSIQILASDLGILTSDISRFIMDTINFTNWLSDKPWEQPILIYGKVIKSTTGLPNTTIQCRGTTTTTDEDGNFSFYVNATSNAHSIPPNVSYGLHQCIITAENNGIIKETPAKYSYVFSDGAIYWVFSMDKDSTINTTIQTNHFHHLELWSEMWSKIHTIIRLCILQKKGCN